MKQVYLMDPYLREMESPVAGYGPNGGILLEKTIFYPTSGGQPNDLGTLSWKGRNALVTDVRKYRLEEIEIILDKNSPLPVKGNVVHQEIDWDRRFRHMKIHTSLHLLSVVIPLPVTGGSISTLKGRLDFDMPDPLENKEMIEEQLNNLINQALPVSYEWISSEELAQKPEMVKTMSVKPPMEAGQVRLVRIGSLPESVDLQPCGGTHVKSTDEIGKIKLGKIEKKGRNNRRVNLFVD
ncbi:MAG: alanyl-tRNA editing protein [Rhodobacteraceae bacterium]|nr:alanyl-tRNA editing protein [Paracoccaceae bacterium]MCY4251204.1 alanyl-tRNA editing protein [Paracoccaceae bacterium]MCY4309340.1 alanyl-tRNA editing protein [Paracoccaceae bacterium]